MVNRSQISPRLTDIAASASPSSAVVPSVAAMQIVTIRRGIGV